MLHTLGMLWRDGGDSPHGSGGDTGMVSRRTGLREKSKGGNSYIAERIQRGGIMDYLLYLSRVLLILESAYPTACLFLTI